MITIRPEEPGDIAAVREINEKAFGQPMEAQLVAAIRAACPDAVSLVAVRDEGIVGHIFFSPVTIGDGKQEITGMGLAPMAVLPDCQRQGIGSLLIEAGLEILRQRGCPFVIVLGHPGYYPRFGFVPASQHGLACPWENVPDEAFMVLLLDEVTMSGVSGVVQYRAEFAEAV